MADPANSRDTIFSSSPGLLPWQGFLVCAVAGLAAVKFPLPAVVAAGLFLLGLWRTGSWPGIFPAALCFCAGWILGWVCLVTPPPLQPSRMPEWMVQRREVFVQIGRAHV